MFSKLSKVTRQFVSYSLLLCALMFNSVASAQDEQNTGVTTQNTIGNAEGLTEAFDNWMLRAYEGDRDAQFKVALMFSDGTGTEKDIEQAVYWYIQAARQGLASAQYNLGHKYLNGEGVKKDVNQAIQWWLKAAVQEHELAQFNVARAYYGGIGVEKDVEQARYWFRKAAANNEPRSERILASVFQEEPGAIPIPVNDVPVVANTNTGSSPQTSLANLGSTPPVETNNINDESDDANTPNDIELNSDSSIAVYNRPDKNSMLISLIPAKSKISVIKTNENWMQVSLNDGFPVWVNNDFLTSDGTTATIKGNNVNARAVPLVLRGSVVGQFFDGSQLKVLETKGQWTRLQSTADFTAWVDKTEVEQAVANNNSTEAQTTDVADSEPVITETTTTETTEIDTMPTGVVQPIDSKIEHDENENYEFKNSRNDNDWLFSLSDDSFTIQLASFSADSDLNQFLSDNSLTNDSNIKQFISNRNGIEWKYLLYGSYSSKSDAEAEKTNKKFKNAWIRKTLKIRKNRCLAWKTSLPSPPELKSYCQK